MNKYSDFLNKYKLLSYSNKNEELKKSLFECSNDICRNKVHKSTIEDILNNDETMGYVAIDNNNKYIGFIFFKQYYDDYYLSLIATLPNLHFPLGQILLTKFEEYAISNNAYQIQASAVKEAIDFYRKMGYIDKYLDEESNEYLIEKKLKLIN